MKTIHVFLTIGVLLSGGCAATLHQPAARGDLAAVQELIDRGVDVNGRDDLGRTALHYAAGAVRAEVVELLAAGGADVNARDLSGLTPLELAVENDRKLVIERLCAHGADLNTVDGDGRTPLHRVAIEGDREMVAFLISQGANLNVRDGMGWTPLDVAVNRGEGEVVEFLLEKGARGHSYPAVRLLVSRRPPEKKVVDARQKSPLLPAGTITGKYDSFSEQTTLVSLFSLDSLKADPAYDKYREILEESSDSPEEFYQVSKKGWLIGPWKVVSLSSNQKIFPSSRLEFTLESRSFYFFEPRPAQVKVGDQIYEAAQIETFSQPGKEGVTTRGVFILPAALGESLKEASAVSIRVYFSDCPPLTWELPEEVLRNWKQFFREGEELF